MKAFHNLFDRFVSQQSLLREIAGTPGLPEPLAARALAVAEDTDVFHGHAVHDVAADPFGSCCLVWNGDAPPVEFGSGVLIDPRVVLTAAHVPSGNNCNVAIPCVNSGFTVGVRKGARVFRLPANGAPIVGSDIAVLILDDPTPVAPALIPQVGAFQQAVNSTLTLCGFGSAELPDEAGLLDAAGIKRFGEGVTIGTPPTTLEFDPQTEFFAGGPSVRQFFDFCFGDSGGPAYLQTGAGRVVVGLGSRGVLPHMCGLGTIFTKVEAHLDFVRRTTEAQGINLLA